MKNTNFNESNRQTERFDGNKRTVVRFYNNGASSVLCFKPSLIDRIQILFGGRVWLIVKGGAPVANIETTNPFGQKYKS